MCKNLNISNQRKKEIDNLLLGTEKKIFSGKEKMYSLKEFNEYQNNKRKEIKNVQSNN